MTATTRRAALGAFAAVPALAIPAAAIAASSPPEADARILGLRAEFERLQTIQMPLSETYKPQSLLYGEKCRESGCDAAEAWAKQSGFWTTGAQLEEVNLSMGNLVERMIALCPKTSAGISATAKSLKEHVLDHHWEEPDEDRDWDVMLMTRFFDGLIECDTQGGA